jgi:hypothetical protein
VDVEVSLSYAGLGEMLNAPEMVAEMRRRMDSARAFAEGIAPVGDPEKDSHSGRYLASFSVDSGDYGGPSHDRAWAALENDSPEALYVEYGERGREPYHVMLKALVEGARD